MSLRDGLVTHPSVVQRLDHMIEGGSITADPLQRRIASALDHLIGEIASKRLESKSSALGWLFAKRG
ncbi:MAG: cell division protein ZapE, partial [Mycobacterium sp.]|nr:cell division protein ZapE [Mycobacterium sp.]